MDIRDWSMIQIFYYFNYRFYKINNLYLYIINQILISNIYTNNLLSLVRFLNESKFKPFGNFELYNILIYIIKYNN